jgi:hypothetical protein
MSDIGKKPLRPPRSGAGTFRPYVKSNQPGLKEFQTPPELVAVPKKKDKDQEQS